MAQEEQKAKEEQEAHVVKEITLDKTAYMPEAEPGTPAFDAEAHKLYNALDPDSPDFDPEAYKKWQEARQSIIDSMITPEIANMARVASDAMLKISDFLKSDAYLSFKQSVSSLRAYIEEHREELAKLQEDAAALAPFIEEELNARPELSAYTLEDVLNNSLDEQGHPIESIFSDIIERAMQRRAEFEAAQEAIAAAEQAEDEILRIQYKKTTEIKTTTDKFAQVFFSLAAPPAKGEIEGQRRFTKLKYEGGKSKKEITLFYDYSWNEETLKKYGLDKTFEDFDYFVSSILDNQLAAGNSLISFTKLYKEMGGKEKPTGKQLEPIYHSLIKGMTTTLFMNDYPVMEAYNKNPDEKYREIITPVMPVAIGNERYIANGKLANGYVKILDYSPFWRVAEPIGHITAWDKEILKLYTGRKTKRYYSVLRFLMTQIGWMRNGKSKRSPKILYSTLYDYTGDKTTRARQLARDMMYTLLDEVFIPAEYIAAYKEEATPEPGVKLTLHRKRLPPAKK